MTVFHVSVPKRCVQSLFVLLIGFGIVLGQKPVRCRYESKNDSAPKYRIGWTAYSVQGPKTLFLAISIAPENFSREKMIALAKRLKLDFCKEQKLNVSILDSYKAARSFAPTNESEWYQEHWRDIYVLDRSSGKEEIGFSTTPDRPKDEMKVSLNEPSR